MSLRNLRKRLGEVRRGAETPPGVKRPPRTPMPEAFPRPEPPKPTASDKEELTRLAEAGAAHVAALQRLDGGQLRSVLTSESAIVRAQVGSGKTTVLIEKIRHLLARGVRPDKIAVFTFTRRAAREINERLAAVACGAGQAEAPWSGTFHGLARRLLEQSAAEVEGIEPGFQVLDRHTRRVLLEQLIETNSLSIRYLNKLERRLEEAESGRLLFGNMKHPDDLARLLQLYQHEKRVRNSADFHDLIALATRAATALHEDDRPAWIFVDELQDTDPAQLELVLSWRGASTKIFAVGDPDQVIYSWRGGHADMFDHLARRFEAEVLDLDVNYRSSANIVESARFVLGVTRSGGDLVPVRAEGEPVRIMEHHDVVSEAGHVADVVAGREGTAAVLVRTRRQIEPMRAQLEARGLSVAVRDGSFDDRELREFAVAYLSWLMVPTDKEHLASWTAFAGLTLPVENSLSAEELLENCGHAGAEALETSRLFIDAQARDCDRWIQSTGILRFLRPLASDADELAGRLRRWMQPLFLGASPPGIERVIQHLQCPPSTGNDNLEAPVDIELMTMHASKGLEFDLVFLSGVNRGLVPLISSRGDAEQEDEERRLLFVAMTRARNRLELGWHRKPSDARVFGEPGPWLALIPEELLADRVEETLQPPASESPWGPGLAVRHRRYGEGVVLRLENDLVVCEFPGFGEKSFPLTMCPLQPA